MTAMTNAPAPLDPRKSPLWNAREIVDEVFAKRAPVDQRVEHAEWFDSVKRAGVPATTQRTYQAALNGVVAHMEKGGDIEDALVRRTDAV